MVLGQSPAHGDRHEACLPQPPSASGPGAAAVASVGWLFVLHVLVLVGYVATLCLEARAAHPLDRPVRRIRVREAV
jgi:hypothetical protein